MEGKQLFVLQIEPWCETTKLPSILAGEQSIDLRGDPEIGFRRLWNGFQAKGIVASEAREWSPAVSPYPGLRAFQESDASIFFGRDHEILEGCDLLNRCRRQGFPKLVMVLGSSGSGKSSLVRAGLVPRLKQEPREWIVVPPFRPGINPMEALVDALTGAFQNLGSSLAKGEIEEWLRAPPPDEVSVTPPLEGGGGIQDNRAERERLLQALDAMEARMTPRDDQVAYHLKKLRHYLSEGESDEGEQVPPPSRSSLAAIASLLCRMCGQPEATVLLVVDQFEELLDHDADTAASRFLSLMGETSTAESCPLLILGTMRSDYLGNLQASPPLGGLGFRGFPVGPMGEEGMRQIIEEPAILGQIEIEKALSERLLRDTGTSDALPLLAFTLRMMWDRLHERHLFTKADYDSFGGLQGAIAKVAEQAYSDLMREPMDDTTRQGLSIDLKRAFLAMARPAAEGRGWARKPLAWDSLSESVQRALTPFLDPHRLLIKHGADSVEVAHEALFRSWERLSGWLQESAEALLLLHEIQGEASKWSAAGDAEEQAAYLLRGGRLARALELKESELLPLENEALEFVVASRRAERAERERELERQRKDAEDQARLRTSEERAEILRAAVRKGQRIVLSMTTIAALVGVATVVSLREMRRAQLATSLEQASITRLNNDQDDQLTALTGALRDAFRLRSAVPDLKRIADYPSIAPMGALRTILGHTWEQQRVRAHANGVDGVAMAADGRMASVGRDDQLVLWGPDGRRRRSFPVMSPQAVLFGEDGNSLLVGTGEGTVVRVPLGEGATQLWSAHPRGGVNGLAPGPLPGSIATAGGDGLVAIFSARGERMAEWRAAPEAEGVAAIAVDRRHGRIATVGARGGGVKIWSPTGQLLAALMPPGSGPDSMSLRVAFSPDANRVITADSSGKVVGWSIQAEANDASPRNLAGPKTTVQSLAVMADGRVLAGDSVGRVHVWGADGNPIATLRGHQGPVTSLAVQPGGDRFVSGDAVGGWRQWKQPAADVTSLVVSTVAVNSVRFHPTLPQLVLAMGDGSVQIRSTEGSLARSWSTRKQGYLSSVDILPGGEQLVVAGSTGRVRLWSWKGVEGELKLADAASVTIVRVTPKPLGRILAGSPDGSLWIWPQRGGGRKSLEGHRGGTMALAAHPDGERFASSGADGRVRFWSQAGEEISKAAVSKLALLTLGYSPDGKLIGAGGLEGQLILLNERGRIQHRFPTYQAGITALGFVPGQDLVATAGSDGSVKVWDYRGRLLRSEEQALGSRLHGLAIHPAGSLLAVGGDGGSLRLVRISDLNGLLRSGCQWLHDSLQREASFMDLRKDCQTIPQESTGR